MGLCPLHLQGQQASPISFVLWNIRFQDSKVKATSVFRISNSLELWSSSAGLLCGSVQRLLPGCSHRGGGFAVAGAGLSGDRHWGAGPATLRCRSLRRGPPGGAPTRRRGGRTAACGPATAAGAHWPSAAGARERLCRHREGYRRADGDPTKSFGAAL